MNRILVAGIGNIFFGDDAFGVEVVHALLKRPLPPQVQVTDFGIRSFDLAYALADHYDAVILVDAVPQGGAPGTLYLIEPDLLQLGQIESPIGDGHSLDVVRVLQMAESLGGVRGAPYLIGCQPGQLECCDGQLGLSPAVQAAVPTAVEMIESLLGDLLRLETTQHSGFTPV